MRRLMLVEIVWFVLLVTAVHADGPPVRKDGTVTEDHIVLHLDQSQIHEVGSTRLLTLTEKQCELLKDLTINIPNRMVALSPHYDLCTCGVDVYVIWNTANTVALPLLGDKDFGYLLDGVGRNEYERLLKGWGRDAIIVDSVADMYYNSEEIDLLKAEKLIASIPRSEEDWEPSLWLLRPPFINKTIEAKVKGLIENLKKICDKAGVNLAISG